MLQWTTSDGAAQYDIARDGALVVTNLSSDVTSYLDSNFEVGVTHTYIVTAKNQAGSTQSNSASANAPSSICPPPPSKPILTGSAACDTSTSPKRPVVSLSWTASTGATSYDIVRDGDVIQTTTSTGANDFSVAAGASYTYVVRANNGGGSADSDPLPIAIAANVCGAPPGDFTVSTAASCSAGAPKVTVSWSASSGAASYVVLRNGDPISPALPPSTLTFDDTTVVADSTYGYAVQATNDAGTTQSNTSAINVPATICSGGPPTAPTLSGSVVCTGSTPKVHLTWSGATNAASYTVFRDNTSIATGLTALSFDDANVANGQTHVYFIRALNSSGSADSPTFTASSIFCSAPPSTPVLSGTLFCNAGAPAVRLTWTAAGGATSYNVLRDDAPLGTALSAQTLAFDDTTVAAGEAHTYRVQASNAAGSTLSNPVALTVTSAVCQPQTHPDLAVGSVTLSATSGKAGDTINVSFSIANVGNAAAPASTLRIYLGASASRQPGDFVLASIVIPPMAAGATTPFTQSVRIPSLSSGAYFIFVAADDDHNSGDVNPSNDVGRSPAFQIVGIPPRRRSVAH